MKYCDNSHCSTPRIRALQKAHGFLCAKSPRYHSWHHHPHHQKVHFSVAVTAITLASLFFSTFVVPFIGSHAVQAAETKEKSWDMGTTSDYTYDNTKIELENGVAQLKSSYTPGSDWIAPENGHDWQYRRAIQLKNNTATELRDVQVKLDEEMTAHWQS